MAYQRIVGRSVIIMCLWIFGLICKLLLEIMNPRRKKSALLARNTDPCVCCKKSTVRTLKSSSSSSSSSSQSDSDESSAEEKRLLSEFKAQEQVVVRLMDNVKLMDIYTAETEEKLKDSLRSELDLKRHYEEFAKLFENFQEALLNLTFARIVLMSIPQDVTNSVPEVRAVNEASVHAVYLCYGVVHEKRSYLARVGKKCAENHKKNQHLSSELRNTREMQRDAEKQVSKLMENIQSCKDHFKNLYEETKSNPGGPEVVGYEMDICITRGAVKLD